MAKKFLSTLKIVNLPSDPIAGSEGELYFNSSASVAKIYQAGAWSVLGAGGGGGSTTVSTTEPESPEIGDSWYKNDTGEFYVYDGTYWVEVNGVISLTQEEVQDYVAPLFTHANHVNASVTYDDELNQLHIDVTSAPTAGFTSVLKHDVRLNGSIAKGQAVYVSSANGTNMVVSKASNASEATSSKTLGLLETGGSNNALVKVVTEGLLAGLDTSTANSEGDPVWLGTDGNLIYGLANKPYAPAHLVFIGVVTRKNSSNGEIFVKVQNGFELEEIHNVGIGYGASIQNDQALVYNSSASVWNNADIVNSLYGTGSQIDVSSNNGDITLSFPNSLITPGDLEVTGNLTVSGSTTYINTQTLNVEDNIVTLNSNVTGAPTGTSGIEIERGTEANKSILWTESNQSWVFDGDIRTYQIRSTDVFDIDVSSSGSAGGIINISADNASIVIDDIKRVVLTADGDSYKFAKDFIEFPDSSHQDTAFLGMSSYDTNDLDEGVTNLYFTNERAVSALSSTLSNYLLNSSASSTYLTQTNATNTYLTQSSASTTYQPAGSYLTSETDPVFAASDAFNITSASTSSWNTAYGWGDHSSAGYAASSHNHTLDSLSNVDINSLSDGDAIIWSSASSAWINQVATGGATTTVSETAPATPSTGDSWYKPSTGSFFIYDGSYWVEVTSVITMSDEEAQDKVAPLFNHGNHVNMSASYDDANNKIILTSTATQDLSPYLTASVASSTYQPIGSYLTSESDTLETVTDRGATSSNAISITNATAASSVSTGALIVSGGVGIGEDLYVNNDVYIGGDINITGSISGSLSYINVTDLVVTDPLIYLAESNPNDMVDIGTFGAYNHSASIKYHTGLIRDASDSGKWKLASNLLDPTSNVIDFTGANFDTLKIGALEVTNPSTTRTNLGLEIGTDVQAYNATLAAVAGGTYSGDDSITTVGTISSGTWSGTTIGYTKGGTGLTALGTAGQVLKVNAGATAIEWGDASGGSSFTNSSELRALLSDETGSGSAVFSNSPTFINSINGSASVTSTFDAFSTSTDLIIGYQGSASNNLYIGYANHSSGTLKTIRLGGNGQIGAFTDIHIGHMHDPDSSTNYLYGNTINDRSITSPIYYLDEFEGNSISQTFVQGASVSTIATPLSGTESLCQEFIIHCSTSNGSYSSKVLMLSRGTATPVITEYAILTQGTAPTVTLTPSYSSSNARLTVTSSVLASKILIFEVSVGIG